MNRTPEQERLDADVERLLAETSQQYEEYLRLAKVTDVSKLAAAANQPSEPWQEVSLSLVLIQGRR